MFQRNEPDHPNCLAKMETSNSQEHLKSEALKDGQSSRKEEIFYFSLGAVEKCAKGTAFNVLTTTAQNFIRKALQNMICTGLNGELNKNVMQEGYSVSSC